MKILATSIFTLALVLMAGLFSYNTNVTDASVSQGSEYNISFVDSTTGTTTAKTLFGTLGSIVVSKGGTAGEVNFYATTSQATSSADLIFSFDGGANEGTYTYDTAFSGGLLVEENGYDGELVITHR